jgi:hypothetical protein
MMFVDSPMEIIHPVISMSFLSSVRSTPFNLRHTGLRCKPLSFSLASLFSVSPFFHIAISQVCLLSRSFFFWSNHSYFCRCFSFVLFGYCCVVLVVAVAISFYLSDPWNLLFIAMNLKNCPFVSILHYCVRAFVYGLECINIQSNAPIIWGSLSGFHCYHSVIDSATQ